MPIGVADVLFMFSVDVPMYWNRWTLSHQWQDWKSEVVWMTLYFSVAVWLSPWLVHAPIVGRRPALVR